MLAAKIKMRAGLDIETAVDSVNAPQRERKRRVPDLRWCFIEPDVSD
jgi:hypothetical protein